MTVTTPSIALSPGQDTGSSNSDGITNHRFVQFTGTATAGTKVLLFNDVNHTGVGDFPDQDIGGVFAEADGTFSATFRLDDGSYHILAIASDDTTSSGLSSPIDLTVDTTPPTVTSISRVGPSVTTAESVAFTVTFSEPLASLTVSDLLVVSASGLNGAGVTAITPVPGSNGSAYTVDVATGTGSGSLALQVLGESITDIAGNGFSGIVKAAGTYAVGTSPASVTVADVNHDGITDLLVANLHSSLANSDGIYGNGTLSLLIGEVGGTFQAPVSITAGAGPYVIGTSDFNQDGKVDLAVLNAFAGFKSTGNGNGSVSILLGGGDGTFAAGADLPVGIDPEAMTVSDLNGDGKADIIVANANSNSVSVLLGTGDGNFLTQATYETGREPVFVAVADLDKDGHGDIVTANSADNTLTILHGTGPGAFTEGLTLAVGSLPNAVAIADLNGDGKLDLVTANYGSNDVSVLLGNGNGTFGAAVTYQAGSQAYAVALSDLNGDGRLDAVVSNAGSASLSILLGNGDGTFHAQTTAQTGTFPSLFSVVDLNGDHNADVVVPNYNDNTISVLLNDIDHTLGPAYQVERTAPSITSNGGGATAALSVPENGTAVTTVAAVDPDTGQTLTYAIDGGVDAGLFSIDAGTGLLAFKAAPDFEAPADAGADNIYDVMVKVTDGTLSDTQAMTITVTDVFENAAPSITSNGGGATAALSVPENGTAVTTVAAVDPDTGQTLTYTIAGGVDAGLFSIDAGTGLLAFKAAPDFEAPADAGADNVYDVVVKVSDGTLSGTQALTVTVTDVDDTSSGGGAGSSPAEPANRPLFGTVSHDVHSVAGEVYALYDAVFDRPSDSGGQSYWTSVHSSGLSLHDLAEALLESPEGQTHLGAADNFAFVQSLYQTALHRDGDAGGIQYWVGALDQGTARADVVTGFAFSPENLHDLQSAFDGGVFTADPEASDVARLYYGLLDRAPDAIGLQSWTQAAESGTPFNNIAQSFLNSSEYVGKFGSLDNAGFVEALYEGALGREADATGLAAWTNMLSGGASRADVAVGIAESPEAHQHLAAQIETGWHIA